MAQNVEPPKSLQMKSFPEVSRNDVVETSCVFWPLVSVSNLAIYRFIPVQCNKIMSLFHYYFIVVFKFSFETSAFVFSIEIYTSKYTLLND